MIRLLIVEQPWLRLSFGDSFVQAQGKLLTPAQKLAKQRAEAMLEAMRAQVSGLEILRGFIFDIKYVRYLT
jgi:hypothetical protein